MKRESWGHALNSMKELQDALKCRTKCLEADVCWNSLLSTPVMRHARESTLKEEEELKIDRWLEIVLEEFQKNRSIHVIKLDLKHLLCAPIVLSIVEKKISTTLSSDLSPPEIWVNADVVPRTSQELSIFFKATNDFAKIKKWITRYSLGWDTAWRACGPNAYIDSDVEQMFQVWRKYSEHDKVTFALRASFVIESWDLLLSILINPLRDEGIQVSITIWTGWEGVPQVEIIEMAQLAETVGLEIGFDIQKGSKRQYWHPIRWLHLGFEYYVLPYLPDKTRFHGLLKIE